MSRSSSVSTKDRSSKKGKPVKQRRDDSENFDVRSQYTAVFPQQGPTFYPPGQYVVPNTQYSPMGAQQYNSATQGGYANSMPQQFATPNQQFNPAIMNNANMQGYNMPQVYFKLLGLCKRLIAVAIPSTDSATVPTTQCSHHHLWFTCPDPSYSTSTMATATKYLPNAISAASVYDGRTTGHDTLCFWPVAKYCQSRRSKESTSYPWKLQPQP